MNCSCDMDYDAPAFSSIKFRVARRDHKCCECRNVISKGSEYQYVSGMWDGVIHTYKTCTNCADLRDSLSDVTCWYYGGLSDAYNEYLSAQSFCNTKFVSLREVHIHRIEKGNG